MTVKALSKNTVMLNGVKNFILPCSKIQISYSNWGGSSQGLRQYIKSKEFIKFAKANQNIIISLKEESGHPVLKGFYNNGRTKPICVKNMKLEQIAEKMNVIKNSSGEILNKYKQSVQSVNESPRGVWSPLHVEEKYKI